MTDPTKPTMTLPTIHMNGTPRQHLIDDAVDAATAVQKAMAVMSKGGPNGRDYYPQGPEAMGAAVREHDAQIDKLREVYAWLEARVEALYAIDDNRPNR